MAVTNRPASLAAVAKTGDHIKTLYALRDKLASSIDESKSARDIAALSRQITEVMALIEKAKPPDKKKVTPLDAAIKKKKSR